MDERVPDKLQIRLVEQDDYLQVIHSGPINDFELALQHFRSSLDFASSTGQGKLLADLRDTDKVPLSAVDRIVYFENAVTIYKQWLLRGGFPIRLAILQSPEMFSDYTPGIRTALSGGLKCRSFDSESNALDWLRQN